jgi:hypothetical protein
MDDCKQASVIIELGKASVVTCGSSLPPSLLTWPLRVYVEFEGRPPRFVRMRTVGATDASLEDNDLSGVDADPLWAAGQIVTNRLPWRE